MTAIRAIFDGKAFVPQQPVVLPVQSEAIVLIGSADQTAQSQLDPSRPWPDGYFARTSGALTGERFERPQQGSLPIRETW
jgi:hypothetical protein